MKHALNAHQLDLGLGPIRIPTSKGCNIHPYQLKKILLMKCEFSADGYHCFCLQLGRVSAVSVLIETKSQGGYKYKSSQQKYSNEESGFVYSSLHGKTTPCMESIVFMSGSELTKFKSEYYHNNDYYLLCISSISDRPQ